MLCTLGTRSPLQDDPLYRPKEASEKGQALSGKLVALREGGRGSGPSSTIGSRGIDPSSSGSS